MAATDRIVAAGAVVTRAGKKEIEFLLIFRKYRGDWTFPKGKVDPGEHLLTAAVREVREETGFAVSLGVPLPTNLRSGWPTKRFTLLGCPKTRW